VPKITVIMRKLRRRLLRDVRQGYEPDVLWRAVREIVVMGPEAR